MTYKNARKLHNEDEVLIKTTGGICANFNSERLPFLKIYRNLQIVKFEF